MKLEGNIRKMYTELQDEVQYYLPVGNSSRSMIYPKQSWYCKRLMTILQCVKSLRIQHQAIKLAWRGSVLSLEGT